MVIRSVVNMNIKVTCDEEWMRCGGELSEQGVEFSQEDTETLAMFGSVGRSVDIRHLSMEREVEGSLTDMEKVPNAEKVNWSNE